MEFFLFILVALFLKINLSTTLNEFVQENLNPSNDLNRTRKKEEEDIETIRSCVDDNSQNFTENKIKVSYDGYNPNKIYDKIDIKLKENDFKIFEKVDIDGKTLTTCENDKKTFDSFIYSLSKIIEDYKNIFLSYNVIFCYESKPYYKFNHKEDMFLYIFKIKTFAFDYESVFKKENVTEDFLINFIEKFVMQMCKNFALNIVNIWYLHDYIHTNFSIDLKKCKDNKCIEFQLVFQASKFKIDRLNDDYFDKTIFEVTSNINKRLINKVRKRFDEFFVILNREDRLFEKSIKDKTIPCLFDKHANNRTVKIINLNLNETSIKALVHNIDLLVEKLQKNFSKLDLKTLDHENYIETNTRLIDLLKLTEKQDMNIKSIESKETNESIKNTNDRNFVIAEHRIQENKPLELSEDLKDRNLDDLKYPEQVNIEYKSCLDNKMLSDHNMIDKSKKLEIGFDTGKNGDCCSILNAKSKFNINKIDNDTVNISCKVDFSNTDFFNDKFIEDKIGQTKNSFNLDMPSSEYLDKLKVYDNEKEKSNLPFIDKHYDLKNLIINTEEEYTNFKEKSIKDEIEEKFFEKSLVCGDKLPLNKICDKRDTLWHQIDQKILFLKDISPHSLISQDEAVNLSNKDISYISEDNIKRPVPSVKIQDLFQKNKLCDEQRHNLNENLQTACQDHEVKKDVFSDDFLSSKSFSNIIEPNTKIQVKEKMGTECPESEFNALKNRMEIIESNIAQIFLKEKIESTFISRDEFLLSIAAGVESIRKDLQDDMLLRKENTKRINRLEDSFQHLNSNIEKHKMQDDNILSLNESDIKKRMIKIQEDFDVLLSKTIIIEKDLTSNISHVKNIEEYVDLMDLDLRTKEDNVEISANMQESLSKKLESNHEIVINSFENIKSELSQDITELKNKVFSLFSVLNNRLINLEEKIENFCKIKRTTPLKNDIFFKQKKENDVKKITYENQIENDKISDRNDKEGNHNYFLKKNEENFNYNQDLDKLKTARHDCFDPEIIETDEKCNRELDFRYIPNENDRDTSEISECCKKHEKMILKEDNGDKNNFIFNFENNENEIFDCYKYDDDQIPQRGEYIRLKYDNSDTLLNEICNKSLKACMKDEENTIEKQNIKFFIDFNDEERHCSISEKRKPFISKLKSPGTFKYQNKLPNIEHETKISEKLEKIKYESPFAIATRKKQEEKEFKRDLNDRRIKYSRSTIVKAPRTKM